MTKMYKKLLAMIMAILMVVSMAACGAPAAEAPAAEAPAAAEKAPEVAAEEPIKIGVLLARADEFNLTMESHWKAIAEANPNVEIYTSIAQDNQSQQYADAEAMLARGCQAIVVKCVDATAAADVVRLIKDAGAYVIIDESVPDDCTVDEYDLHIESNNIQHGENIGRCLAAYMEANPDKQLYMGYIQGKEMPNPIKRHDGIYNIVTKEQVVELDYQIAEWKAETAASITEGWLTAYPEMNVIACANDTMACAVVETLLAAGIDCGTDFLVFGVDGDSNGLQYVKAGTLYGTSKQDTSISVNVAYTNAVKLIKGEALDFDDAGRKMIDPRMITLVTMDNVDDYLN